MEATQHDLSFDSVKLDYKALLKTARIAFAHTRNQLDHYLSGTHDLEPPLSYDHLARLISREATDLVVAAETMHTLEAGLSRSELEIVNK